MGNSYCVCHCVGFRSRIVKERDSALQLQYKLVIISNTLKNKTFLDELNTKSVSLSDKFRLCM